MGGPRVTDADDWLCVPARTMTSPKNIAVTCANRCNMFSTPLDVMLSSQPPPVLNLFSSTLGSGIYSHMDTPFNSP